MIQKTALPSSKVKHIIAIASGKGGVGKSTVATNLALALAEKGASVGLLDADIYGPSQPTLLGTWQQKPVIKDRTIFPIRQYGIQTMSIGYLVAPDAAMMWRGPMLGKAMEQMLHDTAWEAVDYLIVDLPPGTGDIQLSLCQKLVLTGAIIVTTPQDLALLDVKRACEMFKRLDVPILGIVENMSLYHCPQCGHTEKLFGEGGGKRLAQEYDAPLLAAIPLSLQIREMTDNGCPPVVQAPQSDCAALFREAAQQVVTAIKKMPPLPKDYTSKFPKIVVEQMQTKEGQKK